MQLKVLFRGRNLTTPLIFTTSLMEAEVASTRGKVEGAESNDIQDLWHLKPALPLPFCVTFGKSLSLSGLCIPVCKMKRILSLPLGKTDKREKRSDDLTSNA